MLVEVVAVDAADEDARAVDQQVEALDLDPTEADLDGRRLGDRAGRVAEDDVERVEARLLGRPGFDVRDLEVPRHEAVERWRHPAVDDVPGRCVLLGRAIRSRPVHEPLVVEGPAAERPAIDRHRLGAERVLDAVEVGLDASSRAGARAPGTRA